MEKIRALAMICTGRAVLFGALAIGTIMLSFSFSPAMCLKAGAITTMLMSVILLAKARLVHRQKPERTEVWIYLTPDTKPSGSEARKVYATILEDVYLQFARVSFQVACAFFAGFALTTIAGL